MTGRIRHLFVYGTLMRGASGALGAAQRARLETEGVNLGPATMAGAALYNLGRYPGLVESDDRAAIVHGEVIELAAPERSLGWLDEYEGVAGLDPDGEYARVERAVRLAGAETITAWVYIMKGDVRAHARIESGRWISR